MVGVLPRFREVRRDGGEAHLDAHLAARRAEGLAHRVVERDAEAVADPVHAQAAREAQVLQDGLERAVLARELLARVHGDVQALAQAVLDRAAVDLERVALVAGDVEAQHAVAAELPHEPRHLQRVLGVVAAQRAQDDACVSARGVRGRARARA